VNPSDGNAWIAWTCHDATSIWGGDDCARENEVAFIKVWNVYWGGKVTCSAWSRRNPAMTFWQGKIWLAWRGGDEPDGKLHVAAIDPF
jgi:hypothetical protein